MSNDLFRQLGGAPQQNNMVQAIQQLKRQFKDPKQAVMTMLTNGQITQSQINSAMQMVQQFRGTPK